MERCTFAVSVESKDQVRGCERYKIIVFDEKFNQYGDFIKQHSEEELVINNDNVLCLSVRYKHNEQPILIPIEGISASEFSCYNFEIHSDFSKRATDEMLEKLFIMEIDFRYVIKTLCDFELPASGYLSSEDVEKLGYMLLENSFKRFSEKMYVDYKLDGVINFTSRKEYIRFIDFWEGLKARFDMYYEDRLWGCSEFSWNVASILWELIDVCEEALNFAYNNFNSSYNPEEDVYIAKIVETHESNPNKLQNDLCIKKLEEVCKVF